MNAGGLATVPQSATLPHDSVPQLSKSMTCDSDRLSAGSLELRARLAGSLDKMKVVAQRAKRRQDAARPALVKRERQDQHKYHSRYVESALKQHAEQQAKSRELPGVMMHGMGQQLRMAHAYSTFAPAPGSILPTPVSSRSRKRQLEGGMQEWSIPMQPLPRPTMPRTFSMPSEHLFNQQPNITMHNTDVGVTTSPTASIRTDRSLSANDVKSLTVYGKDATTPQALPGQTIPELADSQMMNLMDQFGPGNPLSDLGDGCLEGVLASSQEDPQPSTSTLSVHSEQSPINRSLNSVHSNSLVSPSSVSGTPTAPLSVPPCGTLPSTASSPPASVHNLSNGNISEGYGSNAVDSSTPSTVSTSSSSCCYSQMQSTSAYHPSCTQSMSMHRVQYPPPANPPGEVQYPPPANPPGEVLPQDVYSRQHMMISNQQAAQMTFAAQHRFIYPCMNGEGERSESNNALLRMRQSVDELSTSVEKRAGFVPRFMQYATMQMKQEPVMDSFPSSALALAPSRVPYPQSMPQMQPSPLSNQHMFTNGNFHLQQANVHGSPPADYPYPIRMGAHAINQQQMAMYQLNGSHMMSEQQAAAPLSEQYAARSMYNYRYC